MLERSTSLINTSIWYKQQIQSYQVSATTENVNDIKERKDEILWFLSPKKGFSHWILKKVILLVVLLGLNQ